MILKICYTMWKVCKQWMQSEKTEKLKYEIAIIMWDFIQSISEYVEGGENTRLETGKSYASL